MTSSSGEVSRLPRDPLVRAEAISKVFDVSAPWLNRMIERRPRQLLRAVDSVSLDIGVGETLGLVGESGCGKSTVGRLLVELEQPSEGRISFPGEAYAENRPGNTHRARGRLQMIFQNPYASLNPRWKAFDIVGEPIRVHRLIEDPGLIRKRVVALLEGVGLSAADADKYPHQFSGGQRQRVSIARALASEPTLLVCDEPTSALDVSAQAQVLNLLRRVQREHELTCLFISHDLAVVRHVSDRVGVMYLGRIVELASVRQLFASPRHPYTRMLLDAVPDLEMRGVPRTGVPGEVPDPLATPGGCAFHPRCPYANLRCRSEKPALLPLQVVGKEMVASAASVACHAVHERRIG
ncbi:MAG TPA: ABC transporter ATP-binding protein [Burkholderiaceae bacterium]|nr:ABC transporter ATP-binding protein [Burkholderiaceae bacterium]